MNLLSKALPLLCCFCLAIFPVLSGCGGPSIQLGNIPITITSYNSDPEGDISIDNLTLSTGTLDRDYKNSWYGSGKKGDRCLIISGQIKNNSSTNYYVIHMAYGYDYNGGVVSYTLASGPLSGVAQIYVEAKNTVSFILHMSWSDTVTRFTFIYQKQTIQAP